MYQILTQPEIRRWLRSIVLGADQRGKIRPGATLDSLVRYMGIPRNTLKWLVYKDTAWIGTARQRAFSKLIAEYENGTLDWTVQGRKKVAVTPEKPKVRLKYAVSLGARGPSLKAVDRPRLPGKMPTMRDLLGK